MMTDKNNNYENQANENSYCKMKYSLDEQIHHFEKTSQFTNNDDNSTIYNDQDNNEHSVIISKDPEIQKSICFQETEIQRLSQAYADKYYYEMKFEQYQNLLTQQQATISKLLNEKKELQQKLENIMFNNQYNSDNVNDQNITIIFQQKLDEQKQKNKNLQLQNDDYKKQLDENKQLLNKLNKEQESLSQQFQEYKLQVSMKDQEYQLIIEELKEKSISNTNSSFMKPGMFTELQAQMREIKEINNYLFDQLNKKEKEIEQYFQIQIANIVEKLNQEKQDLQEEFEQQLEQKEEIIHHLELQLGEVQNQAQQLYSENLQLQNQLDLLGQNYQEDIQQQANVLSQQVAEYKIIINNLENQLFVMNAEIQRRGRSNGKENASRILQGVTNKLNQQRLSTGEMTFSTITPSSKQFQLQNIKN